VGRVGYWGELALGRIGCKTAQWHITLHTTTLSSTLFSASRQLTALLRWLN